MSTTNDELVGRVLNAVPARTYEMGALLSVLRIEVTTEVPTASVSCERRPVLRINPEFVEACCRTDEHLFLLVMHELHHVLLGHTRLFPRPTPAHNLAFDAVINALLCRRFPARAYTSFFAQLYDDAPGAARLLAPPGSRRIGNPRLDALHDMLYRRSTVTAAEVFDAVVRTLPSLPEGLVWLGSHGDDADGFGEGDQAVAAALRPVASKWAGAEAEGPGKGLEQAIEAFTKPRRDLPREVLAKLPGG